MADQPGPNEAAFVAYGTLNSLIALLLAKGVISTAEINAITRTLRSEWSADPRKLAKDSAKFLQTYLK